MQNNELKISNLTVAYQDSTVINKLNITLDSKKLYVILGPSGCGKSTLLSAITGLIDPLEGEVSLLGKRLYQGHQGINLPVEKRNIGFVFQSYALWPHMTVYQNIAMPLKVRKLSKDAIKEKVYQMLKIVCMQDYSNRYPNQLSGGEKQRVALARALVYEPSLLLLDEPLANLDASLKSALAKEVKRIQETLGITTIYVTHDQEEAFDLADEILVMNHGEIIARGTPYDLYHHSKDPFVTSFIGKSNIVDGQAFEQLYDKGHKNCYHKPCKKIMFRPEDVTIKAFYDGHKKICKKDLGKEEYLGIIIKTRFKGNKTEYQIKYKNVIILAYDHRFLDYHDGDQVVFTIQHWR